MESETSSIAYRTGMETTFRSRHLHTLPSGIVLGRRTEVVLMLSSLSIQREMRLERGTAPLKLKQRTEAAVEYAVS